ncbi:hypothetical protein AAE478_005970 [Parahypoxylon ruwenzoriense]
MSSTVSPSSSTSYIDKVYEQNVKQPSFVGADEAQQPIDEDWQPSRHEKAIIYTLGIINVIVALDASIIVTSLNAIIEDLGGSSTQAFWIGTSYLLVNAVTMPFICSISDVFGRPICLTFSLVAFSADIVPLRWRPKWYGITLAFWALGLSIGPIVGGAIVQGTTWRWIFYIMLPFCAFGLVAVPCLLTLKPKKATIREKLSRIDWIGIVLLTGSSTSFLIAVSWGGNQMYGLGPFFFLSVKGFNALNAGLAMLPCMLTVTLAGIISGRLVTRFNNFRWLICIGWFVASIGSGLFLVWTRNDSAGVWVITYILSGVGHGAVLNAQNFASQGMCKPGDEASAAAMYAFSRQFGMAVGVGIGGTTFQNLMALKLDWQGLPIEIAKQAEGYISTLKTLPEGDFRSAVLDSYKFGFLGVYAVYLGLSVVALIICLLFVKNVDLRKDLTTEHRLEGDPLAKHWNDRDRKH